MNSRLIDVLALISAPSSQPMPASLQHAQDSHGARGIRPVRLDVSLAYWPLLSSLLVAVLGSIVARFVLRPIFRYRGIGEQWCAATRPGKPWGTPALFRDGAGWGTEAHADAVKLFLMVAALSVMAVITNCKHYCDQRAIPRLIPLSRHRDEHTLWSLCGRSHLDLHF